MNLYNTLRSIIQSNTSQAGGEPHIPQKSFETLIQEITQACADHVDEATTQIASQMLESQEDSEKGWYSHKVECDICTRQWVAVYHEDTEKLECPGCAMMVSFEPIDTEL